MCTELPLLAQRTIEVARALMCEPTMILLDEPTAGATVAERQRLAELIGELRAGGTTVMVIEHNVPFVISVSDQIVVLDFGKVVADGTPAEVGRQPGRPGDLPWLLTSMVGTASGRRVGSTCPTA